MTLMLTSYMIFLLSMMILISFHPIFMGMLMLVLSLFVSVTMSFMTHSWLSFLMFYLMSGGILMLLIYMSCYSFNPIFKKSFFIVALTFISCFFFFKHNLFIFKKSFSTMMSIESGISLSYDLNLSMMLIISLLMFLCFFNISKMLSSMSFSMRKFFLSSNMSTANSY